MKNYIQPGDIIEVVTPSGGYTSGVLYFQGALFGVAALTSLVSEYNQLKTQGVFELTKVGSQAWAIGDPIHWDAANSRASKDATVGPRVGQAANVVENGAGDTLGYVKLDGTRGTGIYHVRKRFTTAEINAGATLLPAVAGVRYRMLDAIMIAYGGAAATATSVDLLATLATASRKLVAAAVAGLTQSAVARAGAANIAVLADGASFTANDVNTGVTIGVTGSALATATGVDVLFTYAMDSAAA